MPSLLTDLFGLVVFLGIVPSSARWAWDCELSLPYRHGNTQALEAVVGNVLWRTAKKDVLEQVLVDHVTASMATSRRIINLGRRVNLVPFNMRVPCFWNRYEATK